MGRALLAWEDQFNGLALLLMRAMHSLPIRDVNHQVDALMQQQQAIHRLMTSTHGRLKEALSALWMMLNDVPSVALQSYTDVDAMARFQHQIHDQIQHCILVEHDVVYKAQWEKGR